MMKIRWREGGEDSADWIGRHWQEGGANETDEEQVSRKPGGKGHAHRNNQEERHLSQSLDSALLAHPVVLKQKT